MNRITRIAALTLSLAAAGTAMAESPTPDLPYTPASTAPLAIVSGTTHDFDFVNQNVASTRTRAEVRAETLAAAADGTLRVHGEDFAQAGRADPSSRGAIALQRLAQAAR